MRNLDKPQRYNVASIQANQTLGGDVMESHPEGMYVTWKDYAWLLEQNNYWRIEAQTDHNRWLRVLEENDKLRAEVERLRSASFVTAVPSEEYEKLKAEVENSKRINTELLALSNRQASDIRRLTKAGDAMASNLEHIGWNIYVQNWNAAKDGKPTE